MEWFGNKNPQLLKAGGTLAVITSNYTHTEWDIFRNHYLNFLNWKILDLRLECILEIKKLPY